MLINCLFYSFEDESLSFRSDKDSEYLGSWVSGDIFFKNTKGKAIGLADGRLYVKNANGEVYCSTNDIGLNYSTRIDLGDGRLLFRIHNLKLELRLQIQLNQENEKGFRSLMKYNCVFITERSTLSSFEVINRTSLAQNCTCSSKEKIYQCEKFFAKVFDKHKLSTEKTDLVVYTSIKKLQKVPNEFKLDLVQMLETNEQFIMLFSESKNMISLHQYSTFTGNHAPGEIEATTLLILLKLLET